MTLSTLIRRSLRYHARSLLGVVLGAAIGSAALIGALVVGDSVKHSLRSMNLSRLGKVELALPGGDRLFREELADAMQPPAGPRIEAVLWLQGTASLADGSARANEVQILGVDASFWDQALEPASPAQRDLAADAVLLNEPLRRQLGVVEGDTVILRFAKPTQFSSEATLSPKESIFRSMRLKVTGTVGAAQLGNFSLRVSQVPPYNAFVPLDRLQAQAEIESSVNLLTMTHPAPTDQFLEQAKTSLAEHWRLADAQATVVVLTNGTGVELHSSRIFLDAPLAAAAREVSVESNARPLLTYLVNQFRRGTNTTPYSMVTAAGAPWTPPDMAADEILINQWLADDLRVEVGDSVALTYFLPDSGARLIEATNTFRVRAIVPLEMPWADPSLMPEFPGIAKAESTHAWDAGFPLVHPIREKDDQYWQDWRGTPKAFVTLQAGQTMWGNRFGDLTAVRWPVPENKDSAGFRGSLEERILQTVGPSDLGLQFIPVREQALAAAHQSQDFGGLFLGFSFFLILAALILMSLLFQFSLEQRITEIGTFLALGFTPRKVRRLLLGEGVMVAFLGGIIGVLGGLGYAKAMLWGLTNLWRDAVGTSSLQFHVTASTLILGLFSAVIVSSLTIALVLRKQGRRPARELLAEGAALEASSPKGGVRAKSKGGWIGLIAVLMAGGILGWAFTKQEASAGAFFGAGSLLLIAGLAFAAALFALLGKSSASRKISVTAMGLRSVTRQRRRSLACVALLACGSFMIIAVGANKLDAGKDAHERSSGTGGFTFIARSTLPVLKNLNTPEGREFFGLSDRALQGVSFVSMRVRDGDEASCLNLNRAQTPRLLGVDPDSLADRGAFTFVKTIDDASVDNPWRLLAASAEEPDVVPAIGDMNSILWAMGKSIGDTLDYTDAQGSVFQVKLVGAVANSILQGNLLIDEQAFLERFPGESGFRMFLVDAPSKDADTVSATLTRALRDVGLELTPAVMRLEQFNAVQNTYLNTFQILGGLGLLLGSAGLGVVVLRNVLERRGELALLQALGFRRRALQWIVLSEHGSLLLLGLLVGIVAALVAILPVLLQPGTELPVASLSLTLTGVLVSGLIWTWLATVAALRGNLLPALRNE